jgi:hypothetical protein
LVTPANISAASNGSTTNATISGGTPPYTIVTQPDPTIATAQISGNTLSVIGSNLGATSGSTVTIQDSFSPAETITVPIAIGGAPASVTNPSATNSGSPSSQNISVDLEGTSNTTLSSAMSGSTAPYSIQTMPAGTIATATINNGILTILGVGQGTTSVVVQDSSTPAQTITFNITVIPPAGINTTF